MANNTTTNETNTLARLAETASTAYQGFRRSIGDGLTHLYTMGRALSAVRDLLKTRRGQWTKWVNQQPYSLPYAAQAIDFYTAVGSPEDLAVLIEAGLTQTQAKEFLGILKPKSTNPANPPVESKKTVDHSTKTDVDDNQAGAEETSPGSLGPIGTPNQTVDPTSAEVLGRIDNLLIGLERAGIGIECEGLLDSIDGRVGRLRASLPVRKAVAA